MFEIDARAAAPASSAQAVLLHLPILELEQQLAHDDPSDRDDDQDEMMARHTLLRRTQ